ECIVVSRSGDQTRRGGRDRELGGIPGTCRQRVSPRYLGWLGAVGGRRRRLVVFIYDSRRCKQFRDPGVIGAEPQPRQGGYVILACLGGKPNAAGSCSKRASGARPSLGGGGGKPTARAGAIPCLGAPARSWARNTGT